MTGFDGFGAQTVGFIAELSDNNNKTWFDANRDAYQAHYITPAVGFVAALSEPLSKLAPGIRAEPKVNGSIFRINRDIRFSKDKTPYKDHLDLWFWEGERKGALSGLFFRLTKDQLIIGAGAHGFMPQQLAAYRAALGDRKKAGELVGIESALEEAGLKLSGEHYKKVPRGLSFDDPQLERLSKFNALHTAFYESHPASLGSPEFVDWCVEKWRVIVPVHRWLMAMG